MSAAITYAHTGVVPNRPHDYVYDSTYTVAGAVDHVKAMTKSQARQVVINPNFDNMFSALRHFPPMRYHLKVNPFPHGVGEDRRVTVEASHVTGSNRFKYFRRPVMPYLPIFGGQIVYAKKRAKEENVVQPVGIEFHVSQSQTVGTQTLYRDSGAQTDPFSPDYVFKPNEVPPELLALSTLTYGNGLPAGMAELEMIERARVKRLWEASLPTVVNQETFERRLKMMEEMELKEWEEREQEIIKLQETRLEVLTKVIRKREEENDVENDKRIERIWQRKMQEREAAFEKIDRKRIKAIRKLTEKRTMVDIKKEKRDIISEYGNFASKVYAPKARDGVFRDVNSSTIKLKLVDLDHYGGLTSLENSLPKHVMEAHIARAEPNDNRSLEARRDKQLKEQLEKMNQKLQERRKRDQEEKPPLKYAVRIEKPPPRPPTPSIRIPLEEEEEIEVAAFLLQNVIRGRAVQTAMYQGKERRLDLINELRARHVIRKYKDENNLFGTKCDSSVLVQDMARDDILFETAIQAEYVGKTLDFLTKELVRLREERRIAAMVKLAERTRRMREAEESGLRQVELLRREEEDEAFKHIMQVHQESVESYLENVLLDTIRDTSSQQAKEQVKEYVTQIDRMTYTSPRRAEEVVSDLVTSFLIPYTEREMVKSQVERDQRQYLIAANKSIMGDMERIERLEYDKPKTAEEQAIEAEKEQINKEFGDMKLSREQL
ncbi:solute carrier, TRAMD3 or PAT1-domain-containing protein [Globomyces pollinis-pini]|nr:solute carrier, TRAMD3 or PAT1-domain-containing protein [Globomyces pollinis-pini]